MGSFKIEESTAYWLLLVSRSYRNKLQASLAVHGLFTGQDLLLMCLWDQDGQTQSQLAKQLHIQQATLTRMINRLEEAGWVERRPDTIDRRISRVFLSTQGKKSRKPVEAIWQEIEKQSFKSLSAEERLLLRRLLMQLQIETDSSP